MKERNEINTRDYITFIMKVIFREAKLHDLQGMKHINERCLPENYPMSFWQTTWESNKDRSFVAVCSNIVVGYILCNQDYVVSFAVDAPYRKSGIGRNLLRQALNACASKATEIKLNVRETNVGAISLYKSHGFEETIVIADYYVNPKENAIEMTKCIGPNHDKYQTVLKIIYRTKTEE